MRLSLSSLAFVAAALASPPTGADPVAYSAPPVAGQVVDDVSGEPLAGVVVVARWVLVRDVIPGLVKRANNDTLKALEAVTSADGRYALPGWGPVARPMLTHLEHEDPAIYFFRSGYYPRSVANEIRSAYRRDVVRGSEWNGKVVRMRRFTGEAQQFKQRDGRFDVDVRVAGTIQEYAMQVRSLQDSLRWFDDTDEWRQYPRTVIALRDEHRRLAAAGIEPHYQIGRASLLHGGPDEVDRFLRRYER